MINVMGTPKRLKEFKIVIFLCVIGAVMFWITWDLLYLQRMETDFEELVIFVKQELFRI